MKMFCPSATKALMLDVVDDVDLDRRGIEAGRDRDRVFIALERAFDFGVADEIDALRRDRLDGQAGADRQRERRDGRVTPKGSFRAAV